MNKTLFHLAFPVNNIEETKAFYGDGLGCEIGRESRNSIIMNLYGHQIVAHVSQEPLTPQNGIYPRHFGLIFTAEADWETLLDAAQQKHLKFYQEPKRRFPGLPTEHRTFFLEDPFYNLLEFKYYCHLEAVFGCNEYAQVGDV
ncbi:VOC family protein [Planktothrix paucivesiculata]|uniref:Glyoxalase/bleomycin resistance protein/dioxygenase n=1 Tax=Planktothrix paucivesiculata PCC 9631 TaxID=671071 RepID=A0A7Z9BR80_9CYAN|nr:VOC family protein [Planktothrix paucivesiculata]VXD20590.1 Glyoxalase/bleomycin resistance protein/dioxygenase [Planktothrix paucivesiculata PCC 9631]